MITNSNDLSVTRERIQYFQSLIEQMRENADPREFDLMASGYRLEIERMQSEVMDYLLRPVGDRGEKQPA